MGERLLPPRDIFLCQAVVVIVFVIAENVAYAAKWLPLGLVIIALVMGVAGYLGQRLIERPRGFLKRILSRSSNRDGDILAQVVGARLIANVHNGSKADIRQRDLRFRGGDG